MAEPTRKELCIANCTAGFRWAVVTGIVGFLITGDFAQSAAMATFGFGAGFVMSATV